MKGFIDKGYHLESCDGRKHTALSEAACQGHIQVFAVNPEPVFKV